MILWVSSNLWDYFALVMMVVVVAAILVLGHGFHSAFSSGDHAMQSYLYPFWFLCPPLPHCEKDS